MAKNRVEIIIQAASDKAAAEIKRFVRGTDAQMVKMRKGATAQTKGIEAAFEKLRIRSVAEIDKERREIARAYEGIARSGKASASDITRAHEAMTKRQKALAQEVAVAHQGAATKVKSAWVSVKGAWLGVAAGAFAAKKAWDLAFDAAAFQERQQAFHNMAASMDADGNKLLRDLTRLSRGTVSQMEMMEKAGTAMGFGIPAENITRFMQIARASAKLTGQTVTKAFDDISLGVARQSRMILDNLMIFVDIDKANAKYAEQMQIVGRELTDAERKQAFLNATMEAGAKIIKDVGIQANTSSERMQRWKAQWKDSGIVIGKAVITATLALDVLVSGVALALNSAIRSVTASFSTLLSWAAKTPMIGEAMFGSWARGAKKVDVAAEALVSGGMAHIKDAAGAMAGTWKDVEATAGAAGKAQVNASETAAAAAEKNREAIQKTIDEVKRLLDEEQAAVDIRRRATEEMYREAGIGAEANARMEVQKLLEKTNQWQRAGVEIENINEYLHGRLGQMQDEAMSKGQTEAADYYDIMRSQGESLLDTFQETQNEMMNQLAAVDESLAKDRAISVEDFASDKLYQIKALLAQIKSKTVKVKVDHSGTGSTERPLTEKISEIQGMYEEMPTGMKFSADMTDVTAKVRAIFADVNREASHYGAMRRELWTNEPGSALYQINQRRQRALRKRGFTGDVITKQTVSQQLAMSRTGARASGQAGLTIQGGVHVTVSGADTKDPETLGQKLADALDRALSTKIKYGRSGIPAALAYT